MKNRKFILAGIILVTMWFQSCEDLNEVQTPSFNVSLENQTIKAGEPVEFTVENTPDFLNFYSGEFGKEYKNRERTSAEGAVYMSFNNRQQWGLGENAKGTLSVLASTDYDGTGTTEAIELATWTDISDRFNISEDYDLNNWTYSGDANVVDLDTGGIIYFAIRMYAEEHSGTGHRQPEWHINNFSIRKDLDDSGNFLNILTAGTVNSSGFNRRSVDGETFDWNGHQWYWDSGEDRKYWKFRSENPRHRNDDWLIADGVNLSAVLPDRGTPLKTYSSKLESFTHTYTEAGTYTITMVGNNTTSYGSEEKIQEFTITVTN